jgi:outer membrane lipoprotein carrier protein
MAMWHSLVVTLFALVLPSVHRAPPTLPAADVVLKVQAYYNGITRLQSDFRQEYTNTVYGRSSTSDGKLYIAKPGKMRWDYTKPNKTHYISDGTTLWVYEEAAAQAYKLSLSTVLLPVAVTFLYGNGNLSAAFNVALDPGKYGAKHDYCIKLTPMQPSAQYQNLWLVVDPADYHVKESIILEASGNVNHFTFSGIESNSKASKVKDSLYKFKPPAGVKVITPATSPATSPSPSPSPSPPTPTTTITPE